MGIIFMIFIAIAIAFGAKKRLSETIAFSLISILLIMYIFGRIGFLHLGVYVVCGIGGIALIYAAWALLTRKGDFRSVFNSGLLAFGLFALFFAAYSYGRDMKTNDEFRTWAAMVKNFYYFDKLYDVDMHFAGVGDYPPGSAMWLYFLNKTWVAFSDSICILGNTIFVSSLLLPIIGKIDKMNQKLNYIICFVVLLLLPTIRNMHAYLTITPDALMTGFICFFVYCMLEYIDTGDKWYFVSNLICIAALCVTKNSGIVFSSLLILVYCYLVSEPQKTRIPEYVSLIVMAIISYASWYGLKIYCAFPVVCTLMSVIIAYIRRWLSQHISRNIAIAILVLGAVIGRGLGSIDIHGITYTSFASQVVAEHVYAFFAFDLFEHTTEDYIPIPYGVAVIGLLFIFVFYDKLFIKGKKVYKELLFIFATIMLFYDAIMFIMQLFVIGPGMNYMAHTPDRYMTPMIVVAIYLVMYMFISSKEIKGNGFSIILLIGIICCVDVRNFTLEFFDKYQCMGYYALEDNGITPGIGEQIFYVDEDYNNEYRDLEFAYYFMPASTNDVETPIGRLEYTTSELEEVLASGYDYLYLQTCFDDFVERYGELFEDPENVKSGRAYCVVNDNGNIKLVDVSK